MNFVFEPAVQALIDSGKYEIVKKAGEIPIGIAREKATGHFAAQAIGMVSNSTSINPMVAPVQAVLGATQMYQTHRGFQATLQGINAIRSSLGVL